MGVIVNLTLLLVKEKCFEQYIFFLTRKFMLMF